MTQFIIEVIVDPSKGVKGARRMREELRRTEGAADKLRTVLRRAFAITALIAGVTAATRVLASFSQEMSTVAAITRATGAEFQALEDKAKLLGATTRFTATQAAEGMTFLARAGFEADEVLSAIGGTLNLAQAGALELGAAADIASNVLTAFRLNVDETGRVVDVLALAANSANTTVQQLGDGMKLVAPIAAGVGVELEEVTAAMSSLSNAGLQATLAGTGLRRVISELESATPKTAKLLGKLGLSSDDFKISSVGLTAALTALRDAGVDTGLALEIFGDRGGPAFEVLSSALPDVVAMTTALQNADGTAERIAATMDDNLNGSLLALKSAFEGVILEAGDQGATGVLQGFFDVSTTGLRALTANLEAVIAVAGTAAITFAALRLAPVATEALAAATAFARLRIAVASGTAVVLGSAEATRQQAAAEFLAANAIATKASATLASASAEQAKALVVINSIEATFIQAAVEKQVAAATVANVAATNALAAARARLTVATQATTLASRALALVNPFTIAIAAGVAFGFALRAILDDLVEVEEAALRVNEAGAKFALTGFGKVGDDILRVQENLQRVLKVIDNEVTTRGFASEIALKKAAEYRAQLEKLAVASGILASGMAQTSEIALEMAQQQENVTRAVEASVTAIEEENGLLIKNSREREIQIALLQEVAMLERKLGEGALTETQREQLEAAIRVNQAFREQAEVFERIRGPQDNFRTELEALNELLQAGRINENEFTAELADMAAQLDATDFAALELDSFLDGIEGIDTEGLRKLLADLRSASADGGFIGPPTPEFIEEGLTPDTGPLSPGLQLQADLLQQIKGPQELFIETQKQLNQLLADGAINAEEYAIALNSATIASNTLGTDAAAGLAAGLAQIQNDLLDISGTVQGALVDSFNAGKDALVDFVRTGELDFDSLVNTILAGLAEIAVQQALLGIFGDGGGGGSSGGGGFGGFGALLSGFGGGAEHGASVHPGEVRRVGERGPELFAPDTAGEIIPAGETAALLGGQAAAAPVVNVEPPSITIVNVQDPSEIPAGMDGPEGDTVIMNSLRRNRDTARGLID